MLALLLLKKLNVINHTFFARFFTSFLRIKNYFTTSHQRLLFHTTFFNQTFNSFYTTNFIA
ncbi:MAG: hypothetical protein DI538_09775 [Azospira oryzae]|nr:MAG: hypothetical protein DI538_09775 [Azospira oryzae]